MSDVAAPAFENLSFDVADGVATIRLTRVAAKNALNMALKRDLSEAIALAGERYDVRAVVVTGEGGAFCAGGDIEEMVLNDSPTTSRVRLRKLLSDIFIPLAELEKPTIAAVNGHAYGAGLSLALACDLVIAADDALFSCAFAKVGLVPDCGSLYFLPRRISMTLAKELIFTGRRFGAKEAHEMGLVNHAVPGPEVLAESQALGKELAAGPTVALGLAKTLLARSLQLGIGDMAELEAFGQAVAYATEDHLEARRAFSSKSRPKFTGR